MPLESNDSLSDFDSSKKSDEEDLHIKKLRVKELPALLEYTHEPHEYHGKKGVIVQSEFAKDIKRKVAYYQFRANIFLVLIICVLGIGFAIFIKADQLVSVTGSVISDSIFKKTVIGYSEMNDSLNRLNYRIDTLKNR